MGDNRVEEHARSESLEELLNYFQGLFLPLEDAVTVDIAASKQPIVYIVGCARAGTTLLYQYLAASGSFTYPTNFVSRFYYAPYIGAKLQEMLVDHDFRQEIFVRPQAGRFESRLGKTVGPKAPHEFWYFWRRFFEFGDIQRLSESELKHVDGGRFIRELRVFQSLVNKPLILKGMILNWNLEYLADLDPNSYFLFVKRDAASNAESLLRARGDFFGDPLKWYSFKPPGYETVLDLSPEGQVGWQVLATNSDIEKQLGAMNSKRSLTINYEDFCQKPHDVCAAISDLISRSVDTEPLPATFSISRAKNDWSSVMETVASLVEAREAY